MEPTEPTTPQEEPVSQHLSHTFEDDLSKAMNATDATEVQAMLSHAREEEAEATLEASERREKSWYGTTSIILLVLTVCVMAFGTYYYLTLTVPVQPAVSVGVFPSTEVYSIKNTSLASVMTSLRAATNLAVGKPTLVSLVSGTQPNIEATNAELYAFIGATVPEPLQSVIGSARLGVVNTGKDVLPFIVASVPDPEKASSEFSIAEPQLLSMFSRLLQPDQAAVNQAEGTAASSQQSSLSELVASQNQTPGVAPVVVAMPTFESQYFYNLPVRSLKGTDPATGEQKIIFLYGYATNNVIVIASTPEVLKAVYDTVITQH